MAFETKIAKVSWPQADLREIDKLNNPMTLAQLKAYAPQVDWAAYLRRSESRVAAHDCRRQYGGKGDRGALRRNAARHAEKLAAVQGRRPGVELSVQALRRQQVRIYQDAERREGAAAALAARDRRGRRAARRAARQDLRRQLFPDPVEGNDGSAGRQPEEGGGRADPGQQLDGRCDQEGGAGQARRRWT